ncbi:LysR family transcriptional regulator [Roseomonas stagni]|uniref:LysR family transcriptional regulator n=1 Tax=Falsiroseomonas algicola TaxID=2716930 RepID=A0A6M1LN94_9PROT|nr:LysR family transcriptional regulator [Falsiroseomonas algicola]NGM21835.1 LysR family transcriptional regulator [Falsiroseomonas algicola]
MSVNLKLLNAFLLIAEHGSFRRAAELSGRSQSALSLQVRELEGQLGASLFHRTTRSVSLTREGQALLPHARRAIAEMEAGLRQVRAAAGMQGGMISLGCPPHIAERALPALLARFHAAHPGVALRIREMPQAEVLEGIRRQELDFGIGPRPANAPSLTFLPLMEEEILALAPAGTAGRDGSITLAALGSLPVIITSGTNSMRAMVEEAAASIGVSFQLRCEVQTPETAIALAAEGLGVAIVPQLALAGRRVPGLAALRITDPPLLREVGIVQLRGHRLSPSAAAFQALLRASFPSMPMMGATTPLEPGDCAKTISSEPARSVALAGSKPAGRRHGKRVSASD